MIACEIVERSHLRLKGFPPVQFHNHLWSFPFLGPWAARKANLRMDTPPQSLRCCIDGLIQLPKITVPPFQAVPWEWEPWRLAKLAQHSRSGFTFHNTDLFFHFIFLRKRNTDLESSMWAWIHLSTKAAWASSFEPVNLPLFYIRYHYYWTSKFTNEDGSSLSLFLQKMKVSNEGRHTYIYPH